MLLLVMWLFCIFSTSHKDALPQTTMRANMMRVRQQMPAMQRHAVAAASRRAASSRFSTRTPAAAADVASTSAPSLGTWKPGCEIRMLYDGECSLCMKEVNFLRKRDAAAGRIDFVDIAEPSYRPEDNAGITFQAAMERIHAILPDGTIVRDVEVFRRLYEAVDLGWVYAITKNPSVLSAANAVYGVWAKYRTQITGREALEVILQRHNAAEANAGSLCRNPDGSVSNAACEVPPAGEQAPAAQRVQ